jgi:uncharacterized protein YPO0396
MEMRFDFAADDTTTGFRLEHFELYNWGTYNAKIITLPLKKENGLLTGDIGSGKSTIVDALTTLLVPSSKITYNKAAGANAKERTLRSYILGEHKTTRDEHFGNAKAVSLRDEKSFSVLLAKFGNSGFEEHLYLAQFFYISNNQPQRFYVVSKGDLSIKGDFLKTKDVRELKKRLRNKPHTFLFDSFKEYAKLFRKEMGLRSEQALNLFYQTVSLKSIGNLTEFIRTHMLENFGIDTRIDEICQNFAELNHTHNLVLRAKREIELLTPISKSYRKYRKITDEIDQYLQLRNLINCYVSRFEKNLLETRLQTLQREITKKASQKEMLEEAYQTLEKEIVTLKVELEKNGASRINDIEREVDTLRQLMEHLKEENKRYNTIIKSLGLSSVSNEHRFLTTQEGLRTQLEDIDTKKEQIHQNLTTNAVMTERYKEKQAEIQKEITHLEANPSNIPQHIAKIRQHIAKALGLEKDALPFVGELIRVTDEAWAGAIERVLHHTALSILVDERDYEAVSDYIEQTHLKGRVVYLKVNKNTQEESPAHIHPDSLLHKVEIKADSDYFGVLKSLLYKRFDIPCVENMESFRRYKKAVTIHGQFKSSLSRHEKDDRHDINDKSRWVLGWENSLKLDALRLQLQTITEKHSYLSEETGALTKTLQGLEDERDRLRDALRYKHFEEIDWYRHSKRIDALEEEKNKLLKSSDIIQTLQNKLHQSQLDAQTKRKELNSALEQLGSLKNDQEKRQEEYNRTLLTLEDYTPHTTQTKQLDTILDNLQITPTLANINATQRKLREYIQNNIDNLTKRTSTLSSRLISQQAEFKKEFPVESKEFLNDVVSSEEYIQRPKVLKRDNLPKWESRFKRLFKEKSMQDIVMLQSHLEELSSTIIGKIESINKSLRDIEYSDGTYIELMAKLTKHKEIRAFKESLKSITTGAITEENEYNEEKFLQLKTLIERFNGREGKSDIDRKWRAFVSDVRNWFEFSAAERFMSDQTLKEYYEDSSGKSGGQKEKLAYTVLASSLAYQFGVEHDKIQSRSFRFVMIDEAFGRGSDESTRYALRLFEKLKLQLLVVTPKQKINVIEPFVKSVHFVSNRDGMDSSLISMSIETYCQKKQ